MFLLIDNYDSFTYNLVQAFQKLGREPVVMKNDDPAILEMAKNPDLEMACLSPGPGHPDKAGLCPQFLKNLPEDVPVLGICLGHQLLGRHAGANVNVGPAIMHGKQSEIVHDGEGIFKDLPNPLKVGRYHSLVVDDANPAFTVTARGPEGEIMALQYNDRPWVGLQFHPESVLTPDGLALLENFPKTVSHKRNVKTEIPGILECLAQGRDLGADMASTGFSALMDGDLSPAQAGAFLTALRMKGESALELAHATRAALARSVRVKGLKGHSLDIVGTGGDGKNSFNCSTAASLIMAGLGYRVVKHGNRAVSSKCGSADALESLGITLESNPDSALAMLEKRNFAFLFAPFFHPVFKNIGPLRKELGIRTLFNILGPMINPARPNHLLMGVARPELVQLVAETLAQSPLYRGAVVCGAGGYDEMTPMGPADIALLHDGKISRLHFDPALYGIKPCAVEDLAVGSREEAVAVLRELLAGKGPKPMLDMITLNTALAILLMEEDYSLDQCMEKAATAVASGIGMKVLENA